VAKIEWLTHAEFAGRLGEDFSLVGGDGAGVTLELVEATESSEPGGRGPEGQERRQFSLVFRGPATPVLPQGSYPLGHQELDGLELFLVPIGPDSLGMRYEAAFA
jgi:hypothetical protein